MSEQICECGHLPSEHGGPGCLYECCLKYRPALDALAAANARVTALLRAGEVMAKEMENYDCACAGNQGEHCKVIYDWRKAVEGGE